MSGDQKLRRSSRINNNQLDVKAFSNTEAATQSKESGAKASRPTRQMKKRAAAAAVAVHPTNAGAFEPENWKIVLDNIRIMRAKRDAPVDTMGAEKCGEIARLPPKISRFHVLVSLMLSSQTKDRVTHAAMEKLISSGLTVDNIIDTDVEELARHIYPVSFYKTKVNNLKRTSQILRDEHGGDIPDTVEKLCKLPGVGPKMAHLCMDIAWGQVTGIGVDTHVHRISNRLGWLRKPTKTPEQTRIELESWMPKDLWSETNLLLVGFGQQICKPVTPDCSNCLNKELCPFGRKQRK